MKLFIARFGKQVTAVLSGFDRLVFRGTLLPLMWKYGMFRFLEHAGDVPAEDPGKRAVLPAPVRALPLPRLVVDRVDAE